MGGNWKISVDFGFSILEWGIGFALILEDGWIFGVSLGPFYITVEPV